jgi:hypothetical protein
VLGAIVAINRSSYLKELENYRNTGRRGNSRSNSTSYKTLTAESWYSQSITDLKLPRNLYADLILAFSEVKDNMLGVTLVYRSTI